MCRTPRRRTTATTGTTRCLKGPPSQCRSSCVFPRVFSNILCTVALCTVALLYVNTIVYNKTRTPRKNQAKLGCLLECPGVFLGSPPILPPRFYPQVSAYLDPKPVAGQIFIDVIHGCHPWIPFLDAIHVCHTWMPSMDTIPRCHPCLPSMYAIHLKHVYLQQISISTISIPIQLRCKSQFRRSQFRKLAPE